MTAEYAPEWDGCCYCGRKSCADGTVCDGPPSWDAAAERMEVADEDYGDTAADFGRVNLGALTAVFLLTVIGACLFLLALGAGRAGMCHLYQHRTDGPSYCTTGAAK